MSIAFPLYHPRIYRPRIRWRTSRRHVRAGIYYKSSSSSYVLSFLFVITVGVCMCVCVCDCDIAHRISMIFDSYVNLPNYVCLWIYTFFFIPLVVQFTLVARFCIDCCGYWIVARYDGRILYEFRLILELNDIFF